MANQEIPETPTTIPAPAVAGPAPVILDAQAARSVIPRKKVDGRGAKPKYDDPLHKQKAAYRAQLRAAKRAQAKEIADSKQYLLDDRLRVKLVVKYKPNPEGQAPLREALNKGYKIVLYVGGIRGGKTYAGARETLYSIYKRGANKRGLSWIISPTYPMSGVVEKEFEDACNLGGGRSLILKKYVGARAYLLIPPTGYDKPYRVEIKTAEHPDRLRGSSLDFVWMDEAAMMDGEAYTILLGRILDTKGTILMTTTPRGMNWLYDEVYERRYDSEHKLKDPRICVVRSRTSDNPYLDPNDVELLRARYTTQFAKQELAAEFVAFDGLVYHTFNASKHIVAPITNIPDGAEIIAGIDAGYSDPFVCLWVMKYKQKYYVLDEYYMPQRTMESHAGAIKKGYLDKQAIRRWMDPSAAQAQADLAALGVNTYPAKNDIQAGINSVSRCFETDRLFITRHCINTLKEIGQYSYPDKGSRNKGEVPIDAFNHAMDALRYIIYAEDGYGKHHPYLTQNDDGSIRLEGSEHLDPASNKLEDWVRMRGYNELGSVGGDEE
jgi:PBSX family phage terminase large subunit